MNNMYTSRNQSNQQGRKTATEPSAPVASSSTLLANRKVGATVGQPMPFQKPSFGGFFNSITSSSSSDHSVSLSRPGASGTTTGGGPDKKTETERESELAAKSTCVNCKALFLQHPCQLKCDHVLCQACLGIIAIEIPGTQIKRVKCPECRRDHIYSAAGLEKLVAPKQTADPPSEISKAEEPPKSPVQVTTKSVAGVGTAKSNSDGKLNVALMLSQSPQTTRKGERRASIAEYKTGVLEAREKKDQVSCEECGYECRYNSRALWYCRRCQVPLCCTCVFARHKRHMAVPFDEFYRNSRRVLNEVCEASRIKQTETKTVSKHMTDLLHQGLDAINKRESELSSRLDKLQNRLDDDAIMSTIELHGTYGGLVALDKDAEAFKHLLSKDMPLDKWIKSLCNSRNGETGSDIMIPVQMVDEHEEDKCSTANSSFVACMMHQDRAALPAPGKHSSPGKEPEAPPVTSTPRSRSMSAVDKATSRRKSTASQTATTGILLDAPLLTTAAMPTSPKGDGQQKRRGSISMNSTVFPAPPSALFHTSGGSGTYSPTVWQGSPAPSGDKRTGRGTTRNPAIYRETPMLQGQRRASSVGSSVVRSGQRASSTPRGFGDDKVHPGLLCFTNGRSKNNQRRSIKEKMRGMLHVGSGSFTPQTGGRCGGATCVRGRGGNRVTGNRKKTRNACSAGPVHRFQCVFD